MEFAEQEANQIFDLLEKYPTKYGKCIDLFSLINYLIKTKNLKIKGIGICEFQYINNTFIDKKSLLEVIEKSTELLGKDVYGVRLYPRNFANYYFQEIMYNIYDSVESEYFDEIKNLVPIIKDIRGSLCLDEKYLIEKNTLTLLKVYYSEYSPGKQYIPESKNILKSIKSKLNQSTYEIDTYNSKTRKVVEYKGEVEYNNRILKIDSNIFKASCKLHRSPIQQADDLEKIRDLLYNPDFVKKIDEKIENVIGCNIGEYYPAFVKK